MFNFNTINLSGKKYLVKSNGRRITPIGVFHKGKFRTTINLPDFEDKSIIEKLEPLDKSDIEQMGFMVNNNSFLQTINSEIRIDNGFLLEGDCFVQDIDIAKNVLHYGSEKQKGMLVFENNKQFQKFFKDKNIEFEYYSEENLKINFTDLDEKIIIDILSLSNAEKSVLASIMHYKEVNKENKKIGIPVLDGSNWLYDLLLIEPSLLAKQFKVTEYSIKILKTSLLALNKKPFISSDFSNINEIVKKIENGKMILIDAKDEDKKLIKYIISKLSKNKVNIVDNIYHKTDSLQYVLYDSHIKEYSIKDFNSFIVNKHSFSLKSEILEMNYFDEELNYLDFEYLIIRKNCLPLIATNEDYIESQVLKKIEVKKETYSDFF